MGLNMCNKEEIEGSYFDITNQLAILVKESGVNPIEDESHLTFFVNLFSKTKDPRVSGRTTYKIGNLLAMIFYVIAKRKRPQFTYIAEYIRGKQDFFRSLGLIEGNNIPSHDTLRRILIILDPKELEKIVTKRFKELFEKTKRLVPETDEKLKKKLANFDGQILNATGRSKNSKSPKHNKNIVSFYFPGERFVALSKLVDDKTNEIPVAIEAINKMNAKDIVFTADAMHCHIQTCEAIVKAGGDYIFKVKENKKELLTHINEIFNKQKSTKIKYNNCNYEIIKLRETQISPERIGLTKVIKMESGKRNQIDKYRVEPKEPNTHIFITSLKKDNEIIAGIDQRWKIENDLHKFKDQVLNQDTFRLINKNAIRNINIINNYIYTSYQLAAALLDKKVMQIDIIFDDNPLELFGVIAKYLTGKNYNNFLNKCLEMRDKLKKSDVIDEYQY